MNTESLHEIAHYLHCKNDENGNDNVNISQVDRFSGHSNNIIRLQLNDGRKLIVKQSDYDWAHPRFSSARNASELLQENSTIVSPGHTYILFPAKSNKNPRWLTGIYLFRRSTNFGGS